MLKLFALFSPSPPSSSPPPPPPLFYPEKKGLETTPDGWVDSHRSCPTLLLSFVSCVAFRWISLLPSLFLSVSLFQGAKGQWE